MVDATTLAEQIAEGVLEAVISTVGLGPLAKLLATRASRDQAIALLDAQYELERQRVDAEALAELRPAGVKVVP
jgi:uncharacterized membrane protein